MHAEMNEYIIGWMDEWINFGNPFTNIVWAGSHYIETV